MDRSIAMGVNVQTVSREELYQVITAASSQNISAIHASSQRLKEMLDMYGCYDALQELAANSTLPLAMRQQAIIQFKNAVVGHWRSRRLLSDELRSNIRQRCLAFVDEQDETIADCNNLVVSKLARTDYPQHWPNLVPDLVQIINTSLEQRYQSGLDNPSNTLRLRRGLKLLNDIIKEFSSMKLLNGVKVMSQITGELKDAFYRYYSGMASIFSPQQITTANLDSPKLCDDILLCHLVFKCLVKMSVWLWNKTEQLPKETREERDNWLLGLFNSSVAQVKMLTELRKTLLLTVVQSNVQLNGQATQTVVNYTKHLRLFGKLFRRLQQLHAQRFASLEESPGLILYYWSQVVDSKNYAPRPITNVANPDSELFPVKFLVQGMILFKESLSQWTPVKRSGIPNKNSLSEEFVRRAVEILVSRFMPLNATDLEGWIADPEEWINMEEKENDEWEYDIRACSERLTTQLCNQFPEFVVPLLKSTFEAIAPLPTTDLDSIVQKEALYCAVGRCANRLRDHIQFAAYLENTFHPQAHDTNPNYPIIKRRIAWLIGKWVSSESTPVNNPKIWEILVHLLQDRSPGSDTVVRLTASTSLRECVDVLGFDPQAFEPFLATSITQLINVMGEADTLESKRRVADTLNVIIEQSGYRIRPFMAVITEPIPELWLNSEKDYLLKASLLVTVTKLVEATQEQSNALTALVESLIKGSMVEEAKIQLEEDALVLWLAALRNSPTFTESTNTGLLGLFPLAVDMLSTNLDLLGSLTSIVESYFLLAASHLLTLYSKDIFKAFEMAFNNKLVDNNAKGLIGSLSLLVQLSPSALWGEAMHTSGLFPYLLKTLVAGESDTLLLVEHIHLFSRIAILDTQMFQHLMMASAQALGQPESTLYDLLLDQWWGKFDNMSEPRHRKLAAMGAAALVSTGRPEILSRLPTETFNLWLDVFGEIKEAQARPEMDNPDFQNNDVVLFWDLDAVPDSYYQGSEGTPEYNRRKSVYEHDVVRTSILVKYVAERLEHAKALLGDMNFQNYISGADPAVLKQIQDIIFKGSV
ncbi:hypothetical protein CVT24_003603 [Panaeolus cyanescens]|uniref:Importin N-terminal domain-containing protein n=1 Tax=Panaeolus cyanescens TaxID=181874 RepID=A0A409Y815_9AGAR|nr:hypothetical protein CVT24_003603 [Panaeolus cyanescens]